MNKNNGYLKYRFGGNHSSIIFTLYKLHQCFIILLGTEQLKVRKIPPHMWVGQGIILGGFRGAKPFSNWKLNDKHNFTVLVKRGRYFFKLQGGGRGKI